MRLPNVRLVTLTSCASRQTVGYFDNPWHLPSALIYVGVGAAIVGYDTGLDGLDGLDRDAAAFYDEVAARIRAGQHPAGAARDMRVLWIEKKKKNWVRGVVVYD